MQLDIHAKLYEFHPLLRRWSHCKFGTHVVALSLQDDRHEICVEISDMNNESTRIIENGCTWGCSELSPVFFQLEFRGANLGIQFRTINEGSIFRKSFADFQSSLVHNCKILSNTWNWPVPVHSGVEHVKTTHGIITFNSPSPEDRHYFLHILRQELAKYTAEDLEEVFRVKGIVLTQNLFYEGVKWNGIPLAEHGILYLDVSPSNGSQVEHEFLRRVIHHELFHLLIADCTQKEPDKLRSLQESWRTQLPEHFCYFNEGLSPEGIFVCNDYPSSGFLNDYSTGDIEEDMAEVYGFLMTHGNGKTQSLLSSSPQLMEKLQLVSTFVRSNTIKIP